MEDSIGLPVVHGFLMVELSSFKDTMKTVCSDLWMEDSLVHTKCCAVLQKSRAKDDKIGEYMIHIHSKIGQGMRNHFVKLVNWYGKNELIPVYVENNIFNSYVNLEVKSTEINNVNDAQQSGNEYGRAVRSSVQRTL